MASKILSFICHMPGMMPGAYPSVPTSPAPAKAADRKNNENKQAEGGHFTAIYENERFVRFKYISNAGR